MKRPTQTIKWKGKQFTITWIRTDSLEGIFPITQVYGVCFNDKNEILIGRQSKDGQWQICGGHPEKGETIEETLKREILEELDVKIKNIKLLGVQKSTSEGKESETIYQVRCVCGVDELLPQTIDPADNVMWERKFVPADKVTTYIRWGVTGDTMFEDAIKLWKSI